MATAKVFKSGNRQAFRVPKDRIQSGDLETFGGMTKFPAEKARDLGRAFVLLSDLAEAIVTALAAFRWSQPRSSDEPAPFIHR
jgi:hypothetical protein